MGAGVGPKDVEKNGMEMSSSRGGDEMRLDTAYHHLTYYIFYLFTDRLFSVLGCKLMEGSDYILFSLLLYFQGLKQGLI